MTTRRSLMATPSVSMAVVCDSSSVPGLAGIGRAKQVAAQTEREQALAADRHQSEEAALVGRRQRAPARAAIVGAIELTALGRDVQAVADAHDAIQVVVGRQVSFVGRSPRRSALRAGGGANLALDQWRPPSLVVKYAP